MLKAVKSGRAHGILALASVLVLLAGCEKPKPPAPPPPPPPPPKAPPPPEAITVSKVLSDLKPDPRVQFPQEVAPVDETFAVAVVNLANSLAKADSTALRDMLSGDAQVTLDGLVNSGEWDDATSKIEGVRVLRIRDNASTGTQSMNDATVWLAIQEPGSAYVMGWNAVNSNGKWKFDGAAATNAVRARAADFEGMGESELIAMVVSSSVAAAAATEAQDRMSANNPMRGLLDAKTPEELENAASKLDKTLVAIMWFRDQYDTQAARAAGKPDPTAGKLAESQEWGFTPQMEDAIRKAGEAAFKAQGVDAMLYYTRVEYGVRQYGLSFDAAIKVAADIAGITTDAAKAKYEEGKAKAK